MLDFFLKVFVVGGIRFEDSDQKNYVDNLLIRKLSIYEVDYGDFVFKFIVF